LRRNIAQDQWAHILWFGNSFTSRPYSEQSQKSCDYERSRGFP